jgi:hypothetical protein
MQERGIMNIAELAQALSNYGVSSRYYRFGSYGHGFSDDSFSLEEGSGVFRVMYIERGTPSLLAPFSTEGEACAYLLEQLTSTDQFLIHPK